MRVVEIKYIESINYLGTQDGISYTVHPDSMPLPDFTEKH